MTRGLTAAMDEAAKSQTVHPLLMMTGYFDSGTTRVWTGVGEIVHDGDVYLGVGNLLGVSEIEETAEVKTTGIEVSLEGVSEENVAIALTEDYQGRILEIVFALMTEEGAIIPQPTTLFRGRMDTMPLEDDNAGKTTVKLTVTSRLDDLDLVVAPRYTDAAQQELYPGDKGLEFVNSIQELDIEWGRG